MAVSGEVGRGANGYTIFRLSSWRAPLRSTSIGDSDSDCAPAEVERTVSTNFRCERYWPVIDPDESKYLNAWDLFVSLLLLVVGVLSPFETAFVQPKLDSLFMFNRFVDTCFLGDMCLQFFISFPDPLRPTRNIRDPGRIIRNYMSGWFVIDFCSVLPIDLYCVLAEEHKDATSALGNFRLLKNVKVIRLLRLVRLLRLARFQRLVQRWHTSVGISYSMLSLLKFIAIAATACHWMACLWGGIAVHTCGKEMGLKEDDFTDYCQDHHQHCKNWLLAVRCTKGGPTNIYRGRFNIYGLALYWAVVTLTSVGYGDITPQTTTEYWLATFCTSITASMWAYVIGAVCGIVSTMNPREMLHRRNMDDLNSLLSEHAVPANMCKKLRRYFQESREILMQKAEAEVISQMSPMLRGELAHFMHKRWLKKVWYLKKMPQQVLFSLAERLNRAIYSPDEEILPDRTLFIVRRGICAIGGRVLVRGQVWGEDLLLSNPCLRERDLARSLTFLSVLRLEFNHLTEVFTAFPHARAKLRWSQLQMAVRRGVLRITQTCRHLQKTDPEKYNGLMLADRRREFIEEVLAGKVPRGTENEDTRDIWGVGVEQPTTPKAAGDKSQKAGIMDTIRAVEQKMDMLLNGGPGMTEPPSSGLNLQGLLPFHHNKPGRTPG